jgi:hypothetical protein
MYSSTNKTNFYLKEINLKGDEFIIKEVTNNLNNFSQNNSEKNISINGKITYTKNSQTKNLAGDTTQYRLNALSEFSLKTANKEINFSFNESFDMKNFDDEFEEKNYENSIKKNFAGSISSRILLQISRLE